MTAHAFRLITLADTGCRRSKRGSEQSEGRKPKLNKRGLGRLGGLIGGALGGVVGKAVGSSGAGGDGCSPPCC